MLILDEPTNHLDIESREALEDALLAFEGAVILVSHDRALLEAVGSRTIVCEDGELRSHPSGWAAYQRERDERESGAAAAAKPAKRKGERYSSAQALAEGGAARRAGLPSRSSAPKPSCARSRRSSPTPGSGRRRRRPSGRSARHEDAKRAVRELFERWEAAEAQVAPVTDQA